MFQVAVKTSNGWWKFSNLKFNNAKDAIREARERENIQGLRYAVFANMLGKSEQIFTTR